MNILQGLEFLSLRITEPAKCQHENYDRVVDLAQLYEQLITGENQEPLIKKYFSKENDEDVKKICDITTTITPVVSNAIISAFRKVIRSQPVVKKVDFEKDYEKKLADVNIALANYYAGSSIEYYIEKRFHDLSFLDPNAFIVINFEVPTLEDGTQDLTKKVRPYPFEVLSKNAVNYGKKNGILQFLIVENDIAFINKDLAAAQGKSLILYLDDYAVSFEEVAYNGNADGFGAIANVAIPKRVNEDTFTEARESLPAYFNFGERTFEILYHSHKLGRVPAENVGYIFDKKTQGQTFVNPFHYGALPYLKKSIKSVAEMDLTMHSHTFPQKIAYGEGCKLDANGVCPNSGKRIDECKKCGGTGKFGHTSSKDTIEFTLPRTREEMIPLDQLIYYAYPPIEGIKFQKEYIDSIIDKCYKGVFNSEVFSKDQVAQTATGANLDIQNAYDPMSDYGSKVSDFWRKSVHAIASYLDYYDAIVEMRYPNDFKLKSITNLLNDLKVANESSAPSFIISDINRDIAKAIYQDRPDELLKYEVKQRLAPFSGKSVTEIAMIMNQDNALKSDKVLYNYFDAIMEQLEQESLQAHDNFEKNLVVSKKAYEASKKANLKWFYDLPYEVQLELVQAKVAKLLAEIESNSSAAVPFSSDNVGGGGVEGLPLGLQQLALARQRAVDVGDNKLADNIGLTMDELTRKINDAA